MRQWRIGTFTTGIILLCAGIGLLYSHFSGVTMAAFIFKWWPVLFILLGIEVLISQVLIRQDEFVFKYDIFSIFMMFIIIIFGLGLQSLNDIGIAERLKQEVSAQYIEASGEPMQTQVAPEVTKIIVESPRCVLKATTTEERVIMSIPHASVNADSTKTAKELVSESFKLNNNQVGDTLFINFDTIVGDNGFGYTVRLKEITLILPDNIETEINARHAGFYDIVVDANMNSDWRINSSSDITFDIPKDHEIMINAQVQSPNFLQGNAKWNIIGSTADEPTDELDSTHNKLKSMEDSLAADSQSKTLNTLGKFQNGNPIHRIDVSTSSVVKVNYLP